MGSERHASVSIALLGKMDAQRPILISRHPRLRWGLCGSITPQSRDRGGTVAGPWRDDRGKYSDLL